MKIVRSIKKLAQKRNRVAPRLFRVYNHWTTKVKYAVEFRFAACVNLVDRKLAANIRQTETPELCRSDRLAFYCMGAVDVNRWNPDVRDIRLLKGMENADFSFCVASNALQAERGSNAEQFLQENGICLLRSRARIDSRMICSPLGNVAVMIYDLSAHNGMSRKDRMLLMRHIQALRKKKADFIIAYVKNPEGKASEKDIVGQLYKVLSRMGVDYIVGVTPDRYDGGTTYRKADGSVARSVYSLGTFLTGNDNTDAKRVILRLRLGRFEGKMQLVEETYVPCYYADGVGLISLLNLPSADSQWKEAGRARAEIEAQMQRIRPADRLLTVGTVMELIGSQLPSDKQYLKDFSVGKVCARSSEVMPGDIFFFREAFHDNNDLEVLSDKQRLRIAKRAMKRGAMLLITYCRLPFSCVAVQCDNVMEAHITVCAHIRKQYPMKTVAITGSIGKTSTKDMLTEVMKIRYETVKSERNANVQVEIGMNLQKINSGCEVLIQEVGGGRPGGASRHGRMVLPQVAVVTNIGDAHIGNFGSREALMENKLHIADGLTEDGTLYLNGDDPLLATAKTSHRTVFYAVHNKSADYYVEDMADYGGNCHFNIVHNGVKTPIVLHVIGEYNVLNAVCCFAIGEQFGIPTEKIATGISNFRTTGIRQNLIEVCGRKLFMDCYNASTESVKSALESLMQIPVEQGKKRIAVIGDITGMGAASIRVHREIGRAIEASNVDCVLLFGKNVRYTYEVLKNTKKNVYWFLNREKLNSKIAEVVGPGDAAMFKGSSKMLLEYSVDMVFGTRLTDQRLLDERAYKTIRKGSLEYHLFSNYATVAECAPTQGSAQRVQVAGRVGSIAVVNMGRALRKKDISEVVLPESVRHISAEAFLDCSRLSKLNLPKKLKYIGNGAFKNCRNLQQITLPDGVMHIGKEAFSGCRSLHQINIPSTIEQIGEDAFHGCVNCLFVCKKNSYAERRLQQMGLNIKVQ